MFRTQFNGALRITPAVHTLDLALALCWMFIISSGCASIPHRPQKAPHARVPQRSTALAKNHATLNSIPIVQSSTLPLDVPVDTNALSPEANVTPTLPEPIQILGGVNNPGNVPFERDANLAFYVSKAGGTATGEGPAKIQIIRGEPGKKKAQEIEIREDSKPQLQSGDIVIIHPKKPTFMEKASTMAAGVAAVVGAMALFLFCS